MRGIDLWTLVHLGFGAWAGSEGWSLGKLLVVHTAWELVEAGVIEPQRRGQPAASFGPEPWTDRLLDTGAAAAGWALTRRES